MVEIPDFLCHRVYKRIVLMGFAYMQNTTRYLRFPSFHSVELLPLGRQVEPAVQGGFRDIEHFENFGNGELLLTVKMFSIISRWREIKYQ